MMSPIYMNVTLGLLRAMPSIAQEVEAAVKSAESDEAGKEKVKEVLSDAAKLIAIIVEAL